MPFHTGLINRAGIVLVVVDMQEKLVAAMERRDEVVGAAARLIRAAGLLGAPVIVTRQYPEGLGDTVPEIAAALDEVRDTVSVAVIDKTTFCACDEPAFLEALHDTGRDMVVLVGMETHVCITQTALTLAKKPHPVHVVADATCSRRKNDHKVALDRMRAAGVVVTTSESVMYEAMSRAGTDEFRAMLRIVKGD